MLEKYKNIKDMTYAITSDTLNNYKFVGKMTYRQKGFRMEMQVLIFKLK